VNEAIAFLMPEASLPASPRVRAHRDLVMRASRCARCGVVERSSSASKPYSCSTQLVHRTLDECRARTSATLLSCCQSVPSSRRASARARTCESDRLSPSQGNRQSSSSSSRETRPAGRPGPSNSSCDSRRPTHNHSARAAVDPGTRNAAVAELADGAFGCLCAHARGAHAATRCGRFNIPTSHFLWGLRIYASAPANLAPSLRTASARNRVRIGASIHPAATRRS